MRELADACRVPHRPCVYVMRAGRYVKIGHSKNVEQRRADIQNGQPLRVQIVRSWSTPYATKIENMAHKLLANYRMKGEWFDVPANVATLTISALVMRHPRNPATKIETTRAIVFCKSCSHAKPLDAIPHCHVRFRCTSCQSAERSHVITI